MRSSKRRQLRSNLSTKRRALPYFRCFSFEPLEVRRVLTLDFSLQTFTEFLPGFENKTIHDVTVVGDEFYFGADQGSNSAQLWRSDGTAAGTVLVKDLFQGSSSSRRAPGGLTDVNGRLFFVAHDGANTGGLWTSDGTEAGTFLVASTTSSVGLNDIQRLTAVGDQLYFVGRDVQAGDQLWKSNGTVAGTTLVKDISSTLSFNSVQNLTNVNGQLFFTAKGDNANGVELWRSDGTAAGTYLVKDIIPGSTNSNPDSLTAVGNLVFFRVPNHPTYGQELWVSDGTSAGTTIVKDIWPGTQGFIGNPMANLNGTLLFSANDGTNSRELWRTDGTEAGTSMVYNQEPGSINPEGLGAAGGYVYFRGGDVGTPGGRELWKSDGTAAGTVLVEDIAAGNISSLPDWTFPVQNGVYFDANDNVHGWELWYSAGDEASTFRITDINPGSGNTSIYQIAAFGDRLFFEAEPWGSSVRTLYTARVFEAPDPNSTPTVASPTPDQNVVFPATQIVLDLSATFADADLPPGGSLTLSVVGNTDPVHLTTTLVGNTLTLDFPANQIFSSTVRIRATDNVGSFVEDTFVVATLADNDAPQIANPIVDQVVSISGTQKVLDLSAVFSDPDVALFGDSLTLTVDGNTNPSRVTATIVGSTLTLNYSPNRIFSSTITIRATDRVGATITDTFVVSTDVSNSAPTVAVPIPDQTIDFKSTQTVLNLTSNFSDVDVALYADSLTLSVNGNTNPSRVTASISGKTLTLTHSSGQTFTSQITIRAQDSFGATVSDTFVLTAIDLPDAPVLAPIGAKTIGELAWSYVVSASDADAADTLTFSLGSGAPAGMTITPGPGSRQATIAWTPGNYTLISPNPRTVTVLVTDSSSGQLTDSETFAITVVNTPPQIGDLSPDVLRAGIEQIFSFDVHDAAGQSDFFEIDWESDGVIDETVSSTSIITVIHAYSTPGAYNITVRALGELDPSLFKAVFVWDVKQVGGDLVWDGTGGNDVVNFVQTGPSSVRLNVTSLGGFDALIVEDYSEITGRVIARGGNGYDTLIAEQLMTIPAILEGGRHHDTIVGGGADDILRGEFVGAKGRGAQGNDSILGGGGNDLIEADGLEGGNDTVYGGTGNDTILGDGGDGQEGRGDTLYGEDGNDQIFGHHGNDVLFGGNDDDIITGGDGAEANDAVSGGLGNDDLSGNVGRDILFGGDGLDTLSGSAGEDLLVADRSNVDANLAGLLAIHAEWTSAGNYASRVAGLTIDLQPGTKVFDDSDLDVLVGGITDFDWYIYDVLQDVLNDREAGETETDTAGFLPP